MSEEIRAAAKKWFYQSFDCDPLEKMEKAGLIAQAEGFSISVMAELELEMESAFSAAQSELAALREELANAKEWSGRLDKRCVSLATDKDTLIDRCKAAEKRNAETVAKLELAASMMDDDERGNRFAEVCRLAIESLKPTESGASE